MWIRQTLLFALLMGWSYSNSFSTPDQSWANEIDSLKSQLQILPEDTLKVGAYLDIAYKLIYNDTQEAILYADSALQLSKRLTYDAGEAMAQNRLALAFTFQNNSGKALDYVTQALATHQKLDDPEWQANDLNVLGLIYRNEKKLHESADAFKHLLKIIPEGKSTRLKGLALSNLGLDMFELNEKDSAFYYYKRALFVLKENNHRRESAFVLDNMADLAIAQKNYVKALDYLIEAIEINQFEGNQIELGGNYIKLAKIHYLNKEYNKALTFLDQATNLANTFKIGSVLKEAYDNYKLVYIQLNEYENAYTYSEKERMLSDSLLVKAQSEQLANLRKVYEFETMRHNLVLSDQKVKTQQRMLFAFIIGAFLLLALIYILLKFFRNKVRSNEVLEQMNSEMRTQSKKLKEANEQISAMNNNLEKLIQERTEELQQQNEKLIEYAHFNAHEIRGPMARLTGLLNLSKNYPGEVDNQVFLEKVFEAISELEKKVDEISSIFKEEKNKN